MTGFSFDVTSSLHVNKENILTVLIHPGDSDILDLLYFQRGNGWDHQYAHEQMTKSLEAWKCRTVTGWDWGTPIWTTGIWRDVFLSASNGVELSAIRIIPTLDDSFNNAVLNTQVLASTASGHSAELEWHVRCVSGNAPDAFIQKKRNLNSGNNKIFVKIPLRKPLLWWPNGLGEQHLYEIKVKVTDSRTGCLMDELIETFGVRDLKYEHNPLGENEECNDLHPVNDWDYSPIEARKLSTDEHREKVMVRINGQRIFLRGGNWVPCDLLYGRADHSRYERLLRLAVEANFNFLRVWGGGLIEKPEFYRLCDRLGITVVQEFPHAGRRPLETRAILKMDATQTRTALKELINHPCIIRYGFGNELYINRSTSLQVRQFEEICGREDPSRPAFGPDPITNIQRHGPHWFLFHENYKTYNCGLPLTVGAANPASWTEYGAAGMSSTETIKSIMPTEHQWPIFAENPFWQWHKAFSAYEDENWLDRNNYLAVFGELPNLETECRCSQWAQAEGLRYANQAHRRAAWQRSECAIWSFNEPWPNAAHSCIVEFGLKPKMAYYYTRSSFAPVDISAEYDGLSCKAGEKLPCRFWVTSDLDNRLSNCTLDILYSKLDGTVISREQQQIDINPKESRLISSSGCFVLKELAGEVILVHMRLNGRKEELISSQTYTFGVVENPDIPSVPLRALVNAQAARFEVELHEEEFIEQSGEKLVRRRISIYNNGRVPALFIKLELPNTADFTDNFFCLYGGETRDIWLKYPMESSKKFTLSAQGWNTQPVSLKF